MPRLLPILLLPLLLILTAAAPSPPPTQPASHPALLPPPGTPAQARARQLIRSLFKEEFARTAPADRFALAQRLESEALATHDDPVARFVLLTESSDLAAAAGDAPLALRAVAARSRTHDFPLLPAQFDALQRTSPNATAPAAAESLSRAALDLADTAAAQDAFDTTTALIALAESSANRTKRIAFVASIQTRLADLRTLAAEFPRVHSALNKLQSSPADPASHLILGTYYALLKNDFLTGLPHLAKSADPALRTLATRELAAPTDPLAQVALADAWWDYAATQSARPRTTAAAHAHAWYRTAAANITGLTLTRIQSRLQSPAPPDPTASTRAAPPANSQNLLALIDPARDTVAGKWTRSDAASAGLTCESAKYARLQIPAELPDQFDLRTSFTRTDGDGQIALLLHSRGTSFGLILDLKGEARLERVAGKVLKDNPTITPIVITNHRRYNLTLQLRSDRLTALLDDQPLLTYQTDLKDLSRYPPWKLTDEKFPGIGAHNAAVTFHSLELIPLTTTTRPNR